MPIWVSDTSPICYFARLGLLDALNGLLGGVRVPYAVVEEIDRGRLHIPMLPDLRMLNWVRIASVYGGQPENWIARLGPGETEALILAKSLPDACLIADDFYARLQAQREGITTQGTLSLLLAAKEKQYVQSIGMLLDHLETLGFYMSQDLRETFLELAGEKP